MFPPKSAFFSHAPAPLPACIPAADPPPRITCSTSPSLLFVPRPDSPSLLPACRPFSLPLPSPRSPPCLPFCSFLFAHGFARPARPLRLATSPSLPQGQHPLAAPPLLSCWPGSWCRAPESREAALPSPAPSTRDIRLYEAARGAGVTTPPEIIPYYRLNHSFWSLSDNKEVSR
jgi:hypothetical protein